MVTMSCASRYLFSPLSHDMGSRASAISIAMVAHSLLCKLCRVFNAAVQVNNLTIQRLNNADGHLTLAVMLPLTLVAEEVLCVKNSGRKLKRIDSDQAPEDSLVVVSSVSYYTCFIISTWQYNDTDIHTS
jgi:hypothetical protein